MNAFAIRVLGALLLLSSSFAQAQAWPSKPLRIIVPNAPGSAPDLLSRMWSDRVGKALGQQIVVENNIAGSGLVAAQIGAKAPADGYNLFLATVVTHATNPFMYKSLPYDPVKDFAPVAILMDDGPYIVGVHPSVPAKSFAELLSLVKANPG